MNSLQIIALTETALFYLAYFLKKLIQRRNGIRTNQLGKGNKNGRTMLVEKILGAASFFIIPAELVSIYQNTSQISSAAIRYAGLILVLLGDLSFIIAMITMKDSWRAGIPSSDKTELVTNGIYKISRNPAFLGFDLTYIGLLISFSNILLLILTLFVVISMHMQILEEEKFLESAFGDSYRKYKSRTGRYFIGI